MAGALVVRIMTTTNQTLIPAELSSVDLADVVGGGAFGQMRRDLPGALSKPVSETYAGTIDFINSHSFFHQGLMNVPIGGGKHFRNVPFIGPGVTMYGALTGNATTIARGREITRGTWDAP